jgi:hypothetical protein
VNTLDISTLSAPFSAVSSDAVIESYRRQLSDALHRVAILEAQVEQARNHFRETQANEEIAR